MATSAAAILADLECNRTSCTCHQSARRGNGNTHCPNPLHDDRNPSCTVHENDGRVLVNCKAGCPQSAITRALRDRGLWDAPVPARRSSGALGAEVAVYPYEDEHGVELFQVVRYEGKDFKQRHRNGSGGYAWGHGSRYVLYHLPEVIAAVAAGKTVYIAEGERDVDSIRMAGAVATCNPVGAGSWRDEYSTFLRGATVVLVQDVDEAGYAHAVQVKRSLEAVGASVRVVQAITGKDAADHLAAGHGLDDFAPARPIHAAAQPAPGASQRVVDGASFVFDGPGAVEIVWGRDEEVLWAKGESLIVVGPTGVGKTTLVQQIVLARLGLRDNVLGFAVEQTSSKVLYFAMDRPPQIRRSLLRMVSEEDRAILAERLLVWPGPLVGEPLAKPADFVAMVTQLGVDTVCIDSLKDVDPDVTKPNVGGQINTLMQLLLAAGVEVVIIHHQRKAQAENKRPRSIDDVYGAGPITWGAGSVVLLWGAPGDLIVDFVHLKQPMVDVGPFKVQHNHERGVSWVEGEVDVLQLVRSSLQGITVQAVARALFGTDKPDDKQQAKARRRLLHLQSKTFVIEQPGRRGGDGGAEPARWFAVSDVAQTPSTFPSTPSTHPSTALSDASTPQVQTAIYGASTPSTAPSTESPPYVVGDSVWPCSACETDPVTTDPTTQQPVCQDHAPKDDTWWTA